jgi:hypothetical protein
LLITAVAEMNTFSDIMELELELTGANCFLGYVNTVMNLKSAAKAEEIFKN